MSFDIIRQISTKQYAIIHHLRGGIGVISKILRGKEKDTFCEELGLNKNVSEILLKIENSKAKYFDGKDYYDLELEIARKYI